MKAASTLLPAVYLIKDIRPENHYYDPIDSNDRVFASGSLVYYIANDLSHGGELWVSDGTPNGTHMVKDLFVGSEGFDLYPDHNFNGIPFGDHSLLFTLTNTYEMDGLYRTDGTEAGTVKLDDSIKWIFRFGDQFLSIDVSTLVLKTIDPVTGTITPLATLGGTCLNGFWIFDSEIYIFTKDSSGMQCSSATASTYLWRSDGTLAGTVLVKAIGTAEYLWNMVNLNGKVYFLDINSDTNVTSLWKSDGTTGGTALVKSFPGQNGWISQQLGSANGLVFMWLSGTTFELWQSDGTISGTIRDLNAPDLMVTQTFNFNDTIYFYGKDIHDTFAWYKTRGVVAGGVVKVLDMASYEDPDPDDPNSTINDMRFQANGLLYLFGDSGSGHNVLWVTDGTNMNALLGSQNYVSPDNEAVVGSRLFFTAWDAEAGNEFWTSDGTPAGTIRLADLHWNDPTFGRSSAPKNLTPVGSKLFFSANDGDHGRQIWAADNSITTRTYIPLALK
jgi:ELWxxDGT repeat protein